MIFSRSLAGLMAGRGVLSTMGLTDADANVTVALTVFPGTQPTTSSDIVDNWAGYNTTYLFHMSNVDYELVNPKNAAQSGLITNANSPTSNPAVNAGEASWAIIWCSNIIEGLGAGELGDILIPNSQFIVGPVTLYSGNGIVRLSDLSIEAYSTYTFVDSTIFFNKN